MNNTFTILNQQLSKDLLTLFVAIFKKHNLSFDKPLEDAELNEREEYIIQCIGALIAIDSSLDNLFLSIQYLSNFRSTKSLKKYEINRFDHLTYHIENFYIRLVSTLDRSLILVDRVHRLGNTPRHCNWSVLSKNSHVRNSLTYTALKSLNKFIDPYREYRNMVIHERYLPYEGSFGQLALLYQVFDDDGDSRLEGDYRYLTKIITDKETKIKQDEFNEICTDLVKLLTNLLGALMDEFVIQLPKLSANE